MSLREHLERHGDWKGQLTVVNSHFRRSSSARFHFAMRKRIIYGTPHVVEAKLDTIYFFWEYKRKSITLLDFFIEKYGYTVRNPQDYAIVFTSDPLKFYPAELLYFNNIEEFSRYNSIHTE